MQFRKDLPEMGGAKNFLKLKDKESVEGIFMGDVHEFSVVWESNRARVVPENTPKSSFRFRINFVIKEGSVYVPKIFEQGATVYRQLGELHDEYDLESTVVKITRNGSGTDTTYSILPLLKKQMTKEVLAHLKSLPLLPLENERESAAQNSEGEEIPF